MTLPVDVAETRHCETIVKTPHIEIYVYSYIQHTKKHAHSESSITAPMYSFAIHVKPIRHTYLLHMGMRIYIFENWWLENAYIHAEIESFVVVSNT